MNNNLGSLFARETAFDEWECTELRDLADNKKFRITPLREMVYLFVKHADAKGISAYQILELMKKYNPNSKPITVYRSLDYLRHIGLIVKLESCSKFVKRKNVVSEGITFFLICTNCGTIIQHVDNNIHTHLEKDVNTYNCTLQKKEIEVSVICSDCRT